MAASPPFAAPLQLSSSLLFDVTGLSAAVHSTQRRTCRAFHAFLENASCGLSSWQALHVFIVVDIDVASSSADRSKPSAPASSTSSAIVVTQLSQQSRELVRGTDGGSALRFSWALFLASAGATCSP